MTPEARALLGERAAAVIFQASRQGRALALEEVAEVLAAGGEDPSTDLAGVLAEHAGVASFPSVAGQTLYHAPELLSRAYARIMDRKGAPLLLMAEEIRANSRDYPRPVPVELFQGPPFNLSPEEIEQTLRLMAAEAEFGDIASASTPAGALYLYSTLHLERGYALFLAQRDESLAMNP